MRIKLLIAAVVSATALLTPGIARADWVHITNSSDGDVQVFVDDNSIESHGNTVYYWQRNNFRLSRKDSTTSNVSYNSVVCGSRIHRTLQLMGYDSTGSVVFNYKSNEQESSPKEIVPGSVLEGVYEAVCSLN